jgi:LacI family transcriptional regulator
VLAVLADAVYGRAVASGVREYAAKHAPHWLFYFEGSCSRAAVQAGLRLAAKAWHAQGFIGQLIHGDLPAIIASAGVPAVNVSSSKPSNLPSVLPDEDAIGRMAAQYFLERGFRQLAFVGRSGVVDATERGTAFEAAAMEAGRPCHLLRPDPSGDRTWNEFRRMATWLRNLPRPAGVFAGDDRRGRDVLFACNTLGLRVPEEVAVLGADDDEFVCGMCVPPLSSVIIPAHAIGYRAAELLDRLLRGAAPVASPLLIAPSGIASRQSTDVVAVDDRNMADALRYIHAQAHRPITVHDVLKAAPQSRRLLELRFRQVLGRTPKEEIRRVHLERAKSLLAQTSLKIQNLAAESGFRHYSFFVRRFRAYTGMTPTAFRNQFGGVRGRRKPAS